MDNEHINFISAVNWVKRGVSKSHPEILKLTSEDIKKALDDAKRRMNVNEDSEMEDMDEDDIIDRRYRLGDYEDESDDDAPHEANNLEQLTVHASNSEDPYLEDGDNSDDEDDRNDEEIRPTDNLLLAGHVEENASVLEVHVHNESDLYCHHDFILPAYPLCFEWLDYDAEKAEPVNYVACGDMTSEICIWDLDVVNKLDPVTKLIAHDDAVLTLSWNRLTRKVLASGSADHTVLLWDLTQGKPAVKFDKFSEKVQSIAFHPKEAEMLLIGDCKGSVSVADCKSATLKKWKSPSGTEIEGVCWNTFLPYYFFASTDKGHVNCYDVRVDKKAVYAINAHDEGVTGLQMSSRCPGLLVTTSADATLKVWDVSADKASFIAEYSNTNVGRILSLSAHPDEAFLFAIGGDSKVNNMRVIDISSLKAVKANFEARVCARKSKPDTPGTSS